MTKGYVDSYYSRTIAEDRPHPALDGGCNSQFRRLSFAHCPRYWGSAIGKRGAGGAAMKGVRINETWYHSTSTSRASSR